MNHGVVAHTSEAYQCMPLITVLFATVCI